MADFSNQNTVPLAFEVNGIPVKLKYEADKYTGAYRQSWQAQAGEKDSDAFLIADLVTEWDVEWKGQPVKLDYDSIMVLPAWAISATALALMEDLGKLTTPKLTG